MNRLDFGNKEHLNKYYYEKYVFDISNYFVVNGWKPFNYKKDFKIEGDIILEEPDENGYFIMKSRYATNEELCVLIQTYDYPSLYKGRLV